MARYSLSPLGTYQILFTSLRYKPRKKKHFAQCLNLSGSESYKQFELDQIHLQREIQLTVITCRCSYELEVRLRLPNNSTAVAHNTELSGSYNYTNLKDLPYIVNAYAKVS